MWFRLTWRVVLTILLAGLGVELIAIVRWLLNYPSDGTFFIGVLLLFLGPIVGLWLLIAIWEKIVLEGAHKLAEKLGN